MSLPKSDREVLLSAALDGELGDQEQVAFDLAIADDASFASEWVEMQALRADLRLGLAEIREQRLPAEASSRILTAIAGAADSTGFARQPASVALAVEDAENSRRWGSTTWIATALALAASLMIALSVWNRGDNNPTSDANAIASSGIDKALAQPSSQGIAPKIVDEPAALAPDDSDEMIVASDPPKLVEMPTDIVIRPDSGSAIQSVATLDAPAIVAPSVTNTPMPKADAVRRQPLGAVIVLAVELTPAGRDRLALQEALRATGIRLGQDSVMGANMVSSLATANLIDGTTDLQPAAGKLFFIEASAKRY